VSDEYDDDYNDFLERIKEYLNLDQGAFDVDFLFLPEPPEIKVEGNFDEKKLQEYFKKFNVSKHPQIKRLNPSRDRQAIDVGTLSLHPDYEKEDSITKEPYFEINFHENSTEIISEAPGIEKGHILLSLSEDGRTLRVSIEINFNNIKIIMQKKNI